MCRAGLAGAPISSHIDGADQSDLAAPSQHAQRRCSGPARREGVGGAAARTQQRPRGIPHDVQAGSLTPTPRLRLVTRNAKSAREGSIPASRAAA